MAGITLQDGTGKGYRAKITKRGALLVRSIITPIAGFFATEGETYYCSTDLVSYTTTGTPLLLAYLRNTREVPFHISRILVSSVAQARVKLIKSPISIANGIDVTPVNANFDSGKEFVGTFSRGQDTGTVAGGTIFASLLSLGGPTMFPVEEAIILGQGKSLAITAQVPVATEVNATIVGHYQDS